MNVILDTCSLFNLANGGVIDVICTNVPSCCIGPLVFDEAKTIRPKLQVLIETGNLKLLDDSVLSSSLFFALQHRYQLGEGEIECIAFALNDDNLIVCCDDRLARQKIAREIGKKRRIGTLGLLLYACSNKVLSPHECFASYELMRAKGGFLPAQCLKDFEAALQ